LEAKRNPEDEEKTEHKHRKLKRSIYGFELETWRCSFLIFCVYVQSFLRLLDFFLLPKSGTTTRVLRPR
jgi:hypothetical protein